MTNPTPDKDQPVDEQLNQMVIDSLQSKFGIKPRILGWEEVHVPTLKKLLKRYIQAECNRALAAQRQALRDEVMGEIKEQLETAQKNLDYQTHETHNENLIREWQGTVQGIRFCEEAISTIFEGKEPKT
jgi:hypothetical protein